MTLIPGYGEVAYAVVRTAMRRSSKTADKGGALLNDLVVNSNLEHRCSSEALLRARIKFLPYPFETDPGELKDKKATKAHSTMFHGWRPEVCLAQDELIAHAFAVVNAHPSTSAADRGGGFVAAFLMYSQQTRPRVAVFVPAHSPETANQGFRWLKGLPNNEFLTVQMVWLTRSILPSSVRQIAIGRTSRR